MSQAEELLESLDVSVATAEPETEGHIVVNNDRYISVPDELRRIAVQYDHNVETVTFDCPRYWDGLDMSEMKIYINYKLPNNSVGSYRAMNVTVDEQDDAVMHFEWTLSRNVTQFEGVISFLICIKKTNSDGNEENHWNSELNSELRVSKGLECEEVIVEEYPDIITQILTRLDSMEASAEGLPIVTSEDNGKFLRVVNGVWAPAALTDVSEVGA